MAEVKAKVMGKIQGKKVMMFSKSGCPYCAMAKRVLKKYLGKELDPSDCEIWEIDRERDCNVIQAHLAKITGARTVPRVFINGKCVGGGTDMEHLDTSGKLRTMLSN